MYERFSDRAREVMSLANKEALRLNHDTIRTEHLLLALVSVREGVAAFIIKELEADRELIRREIERRTMPQAKPEISKQKRLPQAPGAKRVIELAMQEINSLRHRYVGTEHLLMGLLLEQDGTAANVLTSAGITEDRVREIIIDLNVLRGESDKLLRPIVDPPRKKKGLLTQLFKPSDFEVPRYERFTDRSRKVMRLAAEEARRRNHEYIGTEHVLIGLVEEGSGVAANVLKQFGVGLSVIRGEISKLVMNGVDPVRTEELPQTPRTQKIIDHAMEEARNLKHNYVGTEHLLMGICREKEGVAYQALRQLGHDPEKVRLAVLELLGHG